MNSSLNESSPLDEWEAKGESAWKAIIEGNVDKIKTILRTLESSSHRRRLIKDLLLYAVTHGPAPVVKALLAAGGNPDWAYATGTLLMNAAWEGHLEVVQALVAGGAAIDRKFEATTALEAALETNHVEVANYLKKQGANWAMPTLMHACEHGDLDRVKEAIAGGASIHRGHGALKETPLTQAAGCGQVHVVKYLLQRGARPDARALWNAAAGGNGYVHVVRYLLKPEARPDTPWNAVGTGTSVEVIDALVQAGANVNGHWNGCTVLMAAAQFNRLPIVKRLVELGADIAAVDRTGAEGVLDYARKGKNADVIAYVRKLGTGSIRDPVRVFARTFAREFGGKPKPDIRGFVLDSRLAGFRCQFLIGRARGSAEISDLEYTDAEFDAAENAELIIGPKPQAWRGKFRKVEEAEEILGVSVYRSVVRGSVDDATTVRFCSRHRRAFKPLPLVAKEEEIWIGATFVQFTWAGSEIRRLRVRLEEFGALVHEIARQTRPTRTMT